MRVYRLTGGRLSGKLKGAPVLLLDHLGRKMGRARMTPVLYLRDGADLVIVASRGGLGRDAGLVLEPDVESEHDRPGRIRAPGGSSPPRLRLRRSSGFGHGWSRCTTNTPSTNNAPSARSRS
jgi:hypothetical protein